MNVYCSQPLCGARLIVQKKANNLSRHQARADIKWLSMLSSFFDQHLFVILQTRLFSAFYCIKWCDLSTALCLGRKINSHLHYHV